MIDSLNCKDSDETGRWNTFLSAHTEFPKARWEEVQLMLKYAKPKPGERIIEFSTGSGYLTLPLACAAKPGEVITYDVFAGNLESIRQITKEQELAITPKLFTFPDNSNNHNHNYRYRFEEERENIDKVVSLATFHHCDVRKTSYHTIDTGIQGRLSIFQETARVLVPKGMIIIGDVAENTTAQKYFDAIQEPRYCHPLGHPHAFLTEELVDQLCREASLSLKEYKIESTPWHFETKDQIVAFLHRLHNAQCSLQELEPIVERYLPLQKTQRGVEVVWELCFVVAEK